MRREGGTRRHAVVAAGAIAIGALWTLAGCGQPTQSVQRCVGAPDSAVLAIQERLTADGKLRNGKMVHPGGSPYRFISAEIHLRSNDKHDKGDIATWATRDLDDPEGFLSVDVKAREESKWPAASFMVTEDGAIESRACTNLNRGKTRAQIECEQARASGEDVQLPAGQDCSDL